jgi:mono/diheme cytochrome c family protein
LDRQIPLDLARPAALPSNVLTNGKYVFVSATGADMVIVLDSERLARFANRLPQQSHSFSPFWSGLPERRSELAVTRPHVDYVKARLPTQSGPGPMALSGDGKTLVVSNVLADSITVIATSPQPRTPGHISLGGPNTDAVRRGERLFHSAKLSKSGRFACASCHPGAAGDGIPWTMPAIDEPRVPKSLWGLRDTGPYGWKGEDATLAEHVDKTLRTLFERPPSQRELADLVAYLESLRAPQPRTDDSRPSRKVIRGRELFFGSAHCSRCHKDDSLQDGQNHDVGTGGLYNTPSLRGISLRRNFLHDGRANSLESIFNDHNPQNVHGNWRTLTIADKDALFAFLRGL